MMTLVVHQKFFDKKMLYLEVLLVSLFCSTMFVVFKLLLFPKSSALIFHMLKQGDIELSAIASCFRIFIWLRKENIIHLIMQDVCDRRW